ncbi:MAG TPA: aldo/keto reductase [Candidatus Avipropionibacterium avicola]|uniref:Aldo/keto reductase n=1 Tax=Candidatus Avipropionibacterium avicola TaxID=2840701 RepID=A0A9D1KM93_9ACTN|nr:aldo/keto reductase [Candidatus Avipropionibacterium avicola]
MTDDVPTLALNDGRMIPQVGFGVWQVSNEDIIPAVSTALEVGYRHIDTAAIYGNEEGVGKAIADSGIPRDELFVTTKLWNTRHHDVVDAAKESLDKLGLDHVDLYLIHWPSPTKGDYIRAWEQMQEVRAQGLSRSIGVSNFTQTHLDTILALIDTVPAVNQIELHPTFAQRAMSAYNASKGIVTEAYSPLGLSQDLQDPAVVEIAEELNRTPAQVILRWHLQKGHVVFPKSVTSSRIKENFRLFDFELDDKAMKAIDGVDAGNRTNQDPDEFF